MIDIHTHVLPDIDDGAMGLEQSLSIIKKEIECGVTDIVATPHYRDKYVVDKNLIKEKFDLLNNAIKEKNLPINLYLGQEIYVTKNLKTQIKENKVQFMNDTQFILLEFDTTKRCEIVETVYEIARQGYKPIVAHLDRYNYATLSDARDIKEVGGYIQVNAGSILKWFTPFGKNLIRLFHEGYVDFVASDTHFTRKNKLAKAYKLVCKKYGQDVAKDVFNLNAKKIIEG